jgi:hypothetical protein
MYKRKMDKTKILEFLGILSKAQSGYKLSKADGEWYPSSGIFSAIYRTISGDSRKDIIDIMDSVIEGLAEFKGSTDIQAKNEITLAIGEAVGGCENIIETYRNDANFLDVFNTKLIIINSFKDPITKEPGIIPKRNLHNYQVTTSLGQSVGISGTQAKTGVEYIQSLIGSNN